MKLFKVLAVAAVPLAAAQADAPVLAAAPAAATTAAPVAPTRTTALQKVVAMLQNMQSKANQEIQEEKVQFAAYQQWCELNLGFKADAIAKGQQAQALIQASQGVDATDGSSNGQEAVDMDAAVAGFQKDLDATQASRTTQRAAFEGSHKAYTDAIFAIDSALKTLRESANPAAAAPAAVSLIASLQGQMSEKAQKVVTAFLANYDSEMALDSQAPAYQAKVGGVVGMLEQLRAKFVDERAALEKEDLTQQHSFELQLLGLKTSIDQAKKRQSDAVQDKAKDAQSKAAKDAQLQDVQRTLADNQQYVKDLNVTCQQKALDFAARQQTRTSELQAIAKAIGLLTGTPVQATDARKAGTSLLNVRRASYRPEQQRAAQYLHQQAETLDSPVLSALAVEAAKDPFTKVRQMIQDLISRLESEAGQEAQHKDWCAKELKTNEDARTARTSDVQQLSTEVDLLKSDLAKLDLDAGALTTQQAQSTQGLAQAQALRAAEKAQNAKVVQDAKDAEAAVAQAITLLREFYQQVGTSFIQVAEVQGQPKIFSGPYNGQSGSASVIALLEVIQGDYARLESSVTAADTVSQQKLDKLAEDSGTLQQQITNDLQHITTAKATKQQQVLDKSRDLDSGKKELKAAQDYFEKLKPSCLAVGESQEQRTARREAEIRSLQEALRLLNGDGAASF